MKKTLSLIDKLIRLANGEMLPASSLKGDWFEQMQADGILLTVTHGSRKVLRVTDTTIFLHYLASQYEIRDLEQTRQLLQKDDLDRAEQVNITGDSKFVTHRTFTGFLVNSYQPIDAMLNGKPLKIHPQEGSFLFISDYRHFCVPPEVVIVGIENAENFRYIERQEYLFSAYPQVLFVSRYPQKQSKDLIQWLMSIPNQYVHFGDFDLAGLHIYETEYYTHIPDRASFLIPEDIGTRLQKGSAARYNDQYEKFKNYRPTDERIQYLYELIHKYHRCYDQEGYIEKT